MKKVLFGALCALSLMIVAVLPARSMPTVVTQDIIFVFDSSGSLGSSGYQQQIDFMTDIIQNYGDDPLHPTRFGLVEFSNGAYDRWNLYDDQTPSTIIQELNNLNLLASVTHTRTGVQSAIDMFVRDSINTGLNSVMTMVLITDGNPYPTSYNPCNVPSQKTVLDSYGIQTQIIGSGNSWNPLNLSCLVDDPSTQIAEIANFNDPTLFQQGFITMSAPGIAAMFGFGVAGIAAARRRAC